MHTFERISNTALSKIFISSWHTDSPAHPLPSSRAILSRRIVVVDPNTGEEVGVQEALKQDIIDEDTAGRLLAREGQWTEK